MADLQALVRLRRFRVEEKQKALADLYRASEALEAEREERLATLAREKQIAEDLGDPTSYTDYGRYADGVHRKVVKIDKELAKLETRIQIAQDDMRTAFADMKRIEIVQRRRKEDEQRKLIAKETLELDDIGIEAFRRREE